MDPLTLSGIFSLGSKLIDRFFPDKAASDAAKLELLKMQQTGELANLAAETDLAKAQIGVDAVEAANESVFVSGGRPFVIWVGGFGFAYAAIIEPLLRFIAQVMYHYNGAFPAIDTMLTLQVLGGVLGLGALRSLDKRAP